MQTQRRLLCSHRVRTPIPLSCAHGPRRITKRHPIAPPQEGNATRRDAPTPLHAAVPDSIGVALLITLGATIAA